MRNDSTIGRKLHDPVFPSAEVPRINHNEHLVPGNILAVEKALVKKQFLSQFTGEENKVHKSIKSPIAKFFQSSIPLEVMNSCNCPILIVKPSN